MLWGDFKNSSAGEHSALEHYSSHAIEKQHSATPAGPATIQQPVPGGVGPATGTLGVIGPSGASTAIQRSNAPGGSLTHRPLPSSGARYLELCINTDQYSIVLEEIDISGASAIHTDGQLFREIRARYDQARSKLIAHRFKLFKPKSVNYVQVR